MRVRVVYLVIAAQHQPDALSANGCAIAAQLAGGLGVLAGGGIAGAIDLETL